MVGHPEAILVPEPSLDESLYQELLIIGYFTETILRRFPSQAFEFRSRICLA